MPDKGKTIGGSVVLLRDLFTEVDEVYGPLLMAMCLNFLPCPPQIKYLAYIAINLINKRRDQKLILFVHLPV